MYPLACEFLVEAQNIFNIEVINCEDVLLLIVFVGTRDPELADLQSLEGVSSLTRLEEYHFLRIAIYVTLFPSKKCLLFS
jgi:hypothetical protein